MYGKQFAANSFALPDRPTPKDYYKDVGDDNLTLLERLPLSLRADPPRGDVPYESRARGRRAAGETCHTNQERRAIRIKRYGRDW